MKARLLVVLVCLIALAGCNPGGAVAEAGPRAWIDAPESGTLLPLAPVEVISHATDPGGIAEVELSANGAVISSDAVTETTALITMRQTWTPAADGVYLLSIRAQSKSGVWSPVASVEVTVGEGDAAPTQEATDEVITEPTPTWTPIPTQTPGGPTATATSIEPTVQPRLRYVYEPDFITVGECFTLTWQGQNVTNVIVQGNPKPNQSSETFCPTTTTVYRLSATGPNGPINHEFTMVVNAAGGATTAPPAATTAAPPPAQTPGIGAVTKSANSLDETAGCSGGTAVRITAAVSDAISVTLFYRLQGSPTFSQIAMGNVGGNDWAATLRQDFEITDAGTLEYFVSAANAAGSVQSATFADITVNSCKP